MPLYFLRHGECQANEDGVYAGKRDDSPLTKRGLDQARQAGEELKNLNLTIDRIIASKLRRTTDTAIAVAGIIGFDVSKITYDDRIIEFDLGALTGTPIQEISPEELTNAEGADDPYIFRDRALTFLREYRTSPDTILIVSHAGIGRAIESARQNIDPSRLSTIPAYPNAHVVKLDLDWLDSYSPPITN